MLLKPELFLAVSAKSDADLTSFLAQSLITFNLCTILFEMRYVFLLLHSPSKKDALMLRRLKKQQVSGPIKDARGGEDRKYWLSKCCSTSVYWKRCRTTLLENIWDYVHKL